MARALATRAVVKILGYPQHRSIAASQHRSIAASSFDIEFAGMRNVRIDGMWTVGLSIMTS
jgi:hypothetical protein